MRLVRPLLAVEVVRCIATTTSTIRTTAAIGILRTEALGTGPGLNQGAIHTEVLISWRSDRIE